METPNVETRAIPERGNQWGSRRFFCGWALPWAIPERGNRRAPNVKTYPSTDAWTISAMRFESYISRTQPQSSPTLIPWSCACRQTTEQTSSTAVFACESSSPWRAPVAWAWAWHQSHNCRASFIVMRGVYTTPNMETSGAIFSRYQLSISTPNVETGGENANNNN